MPSINKKIRVPGKEKKEIYQKVSKEIDRFLEKDSSIHLEFEQIAKESQVLVSSKYVNGTIQCEDQEVVIALKLSLLAMPFQGKIEEGIDRWIQRSFSDVSKNSAGQNSKSGKIKKG